MTQQQVGGHPELRRSCCMMRKAQRLSASVRTWFRRLMPTFAVMAHMDRQVDPSVPRPFPESYMSCEMRITAAILGKGARRHRSHSILRKQGPSLPSVFSVCERNMGYKLTVDFFFSSLNLMCLLWPTNHQAKYLISLNRCVVTPQINDSSK